MHPANILCLSNFLAWIQPSYRYSTCFNCIWTPFFRFCGYIQFDVLFPLRIRAMVSGKRLADLGYRAFTTSMMLLTVYGGYLCAMRGYRYMERQRQLKLAAENQDPEIIKD